MNEAVPPEIEAKPVAVEKSSGRETSQYKTVRQNDGCCNVREKLLLNLHQH